MSKHDSFASRLGGIILGLVITAALSSVFIGCVIPSAWRPIPVEKPPARPEPPVQPPPVTPTPDPPKPPEEQGCTIPTETGETCVLSGPTTTANMRYLDALDTAILGIEQRKPDLFDFKRAPYPDGYLVLDRPAFFRELQRTLQASGFCVTVDVQFEEIQIADTPKAGYQSFTPLRADNRVRQKVGYFRSACAWTAAPPAPVIACPLTLDQDHTLDIVLKIDRLPNRVVVDETTKFCGFPVPVKVLSNCGTKCCLLGIHSGEVGLACDLALLGPLEWSSTEATLEDWAGQDGKVNPYMKVIRGKGLVKVCGTKVDICKSVEVQ